MTIDWKNLVLRNDDKIKRWIEFMDRAEKRPDDRGLSFYHRTFVYGIEGALCSYISRESSYFRNEALIPLAEKGASLLLASLNDDGTVNSTNMASPPDTAFTAERAGAILVLLNKKAPSLPGTEALQELLSRYLERTCDALVTGGIHTPNHRWVVSSALSYGFYLLNKDDYRKRAEEWLGEGLDMDAEGQFSERSASIYSPVIVHCLLNMADYLGRKDLLEPVRRNLDMTRLLFKPDGTLITLASRRQDAYFDGESSHYYLPYLIMAVREGNGDYSDAVRLIQEKGFLPDQGLTELLSGRAEGELPQPIGDLPVAGDHRIEGSGLYRSYEKGLFYTLFGGGDKQEPFRYTSGLSSHPTFLSLQKGQASLESIRIAPRFFSTGYFKADSLSFPDKICVLEQRLQVPFYDRLSDEDLNPQGDYGLSSAGRYWSKMDFHSRKQVNIQNLETRVSIEKNGTGLSLRISCEGCPHVPVALEFMFPEAGELEGTWLDRRSGLFESSDSPYPDSVHILREGTAKYHCGSETITFGPGQAEHDWLPILNRESFFPLDKEHLNHQFVYLSAYTPFCIILEIR